MGPEKREIYCSCTAVVYVITSEFRKNRSSVFGTAAETKKKSNDREEKDHFIFFSSQ